MCSDKYCKVCNPKKYTVAEALDAMREARMKIRIIQFEQRWGKDRRTWR